MKHQTDDATRLISIREALTAGNGDWQNIVALWSINADLTWLLERAESELAAARGEPTYRTYTQAQHDESERQLRDCYDRLAARGEPPEPRLREAAEKAVHLVGNYLWNEDGESEDWLIEAHDALRAALAPSAEPPETT